MPRKPPIYAVDWSHDDNALAVFDGTAITHEMPEPIPGMIIATENIPMKYARPYFDAGVRLFRCKTSETAKVRKAEGIEKDHDADARIIYDLYRSKSSLFREWRFDPFFAVLGDLYSAFKEVQHSRVAASNRIYANSHPKIKAVLETLEEHEKAILKEMKGILEHMPIYAEFLLQIKGIGPAVASGLLAYMGNVARFSNVSHAYAYFGLDVRGGKAPRKTKGQTANWSHKGRCLLLGVIGDSFVKHRTPKYRDIYDAEKARQKPLCEAAGLKPIAAERRARRKAVKVFFKDFFQAYRRLGIGEVLDYVNNPVAYEKPKRRARKKTVELELAVA